MNTIKAIKNWVKRKPNESKNECNFSNNYYGDQLCLAKSQVAKNRVKK